MDRSRVVAAPTLVLGGIGATLFLIAVVHHATEFFTLAERIGPVAAIVLDGTLALGFVYAGYRLSGTELPQARQWAVCLWSFAGIALAVAVIGATYLIRLLEGRVVAEPVFPLLIAAEAGGLAGTTAGYYHARARQEARQARAASEQLEAANEQLAATNQQLEATNEQLEATNRELETANRELEASNERLEQFAYAASHDLQEPLRMVTSYLDLVEERYGDELDEDGREFIGYAVDGAERMREMIDSLLAYSRVETEGEPFEPVDLDAVLADVLSDLRFQIEEERARIDVEDLPCVEGDGGQLRQVFQNLLDNAMEYSGEEPPRVHVSVERDGDEWVVSVHDEGIGIDPEHTDRIFQVFQRLHALDEHAGTGIGLAMCERIVNRHGGEIAVESEPGAGTTFWVTLPAVQDGGE